MFFGIVYCFIGIAFAALGTSISWRRAAWLVSGAVFAVHIANEHFRQRNPPTTTALHASLAAALGAFGLAVAANVHELGEASDYRIRMLLALVSWPLITAVPAFIVALVVAAGLGLKRLRDPSGKP